MKFSGLGIVAAALSDDPRAAAAASRAAGFAGVQFDAISSAFDLTELSISGRREFRRMLSNESQHLISQRTDAGPKGFSPGVDVDRILSRLDKILETAAGMASPLVCLDLGSLPQPAASLAPRPAITPQQAGVILLPDPSIVARPVAPAAPPPSPADTAFISQIDAVLAELARRADRYSVTLALRSSLASFAALRRAIDAAGCSWFGIDFDPVAALQDQRDMDEIFSSVASQIRHVRARDATVGDQNRTHPAVIGKGSVDWPATLARLEESGYSGWITLDPLDLLDRRAAALTGRKFLAPLITA